MSQTVDPGVIANPATINAPVVVQGVAPAVIAQDVIVYPLSKITQGTLPNLGIELRIYRRSAPNTFVDILPRTRERKWLDQLSAPGSGSFDIHVDDEKIAADPTLLDYGNIVRCLLDGVERFAWVIETKQRSIVSPEEKGGEWITVSGRGVLSIMEEAVIYPSGGLADPSTDRPFESHTSGVIIGDLLSEAQARGALSAVSQDFSDTIDSQGDAFETISLGLRVGEDLLTVLGRLAALAVDVQMTPSLVLRMFENDRGQDLSEDTATHGAVILRPAHNIDEAVASSTGLIRNTLLVAVPGGVVEREDAASVSEHGRREAYLSLGQAVDTTEVDIAASAAFVKTAQPRDALRMQIEDVEDHRPYIDFQVGDWILAPGADAQLARYRVRALTVTEDEEGHPIFVPELSTLLDELEEKFLRWLTSISPGGDLYPDISTPIEDIGAGDTGIFEVAAGMQAHYRAEDLELNDGDEVTTWEPFVGTHTLSGSRGDYRVIAALNDKPVVRFVERNGGNPAVYSSGTFADEDFGDDRTIALVFKAQRGQGSSGDLDSLETMAYLVLANIGGQRAVDAFCIDSSYRLICYTYAGAVDDDFLVGPVVGSATSTTYHIAFFRKDTSANAAHLWVDGALVDTQAPLSGAGDERIDSIGLGDNDDGFKGDIAEYLVWPRALSNAEINESTVALKNKYGIS